MSATVIAEQGPPSAAPRGQQLVPSAVLGMLLFILTESMLFAGMISAYQIVQSRAPEGWWPPPAQPRLPVWETAFNSAFLLASGVAIFFAHRAFKRAPARATRWVLGALILGAAFVGLQGVEWAALIREGLTVTTSAHAAFFYLLVGTHAVHAVGALIYLTVIYRRLRAGALTAEGFYAAQIFWYFVVGLWPLLYARIYLL